MNCALGDRTEWAVRQVRRVLRCGGVAVFNINWHRDMQGDVSTIRDVFPGRTFQFRVTSETGARLQQIVVAPSAPSCFPSAAARSIYLSAWHAIVRAFIGDAEVQ